MADLPTLKTENERIFGSKTPSISKLVLRKGVLDGALCDESSN